MQGNKTQSLNLHLEDVDCEKTSSTGGQSEGEVMEEIMEEEDVAGKKEGSK